MVAYSDPSAPLSLLKKMNVFSNSPVIVRWSMIRPIWVSMTSTIAA